jgi:PAS domain S-box-containing protein
MKTARLNTRRPKLPRRPRSTPAPLEVQLRSEKEFRPFKDAAVGYFTLDRRGRIAEVNETGASLLGYPGSWLLGRAFVVFVARQDVTRFLRFLRESATAPRSLVTEIDLFMGARTVPVKVFISAWVESESESEFTHRLAVVTLMNDPEALRQNSSSRWHSLIHNAPDTILAVDVDGRIVFANKPFFGYSPSVLTNANLLDYLPEENHSKVLRSLNSVFHFSQHSMCEISVLSGDEYRWFNLSFGQPHLQPTEHAGRRTVITTVVIREVSVQKHAEEALRATGNQMRNFAARIDVVREEERARIAREIHDELGQALTALKLDLAWVREKTKPRNGTRKKMAAMISEVDRTIDLVRRISSELRPAVLDDLGLIPAIEWQLTQFRKRTGVRTEFRSSHESLVLSRDASAAVFRVIQEALTNIMRHAQATRVIVLINQADDLIKISITDNGKGMSRNQGASFSSLGIVGMRERISRLGGELVLSSTQGQGTRVDITLPENND